LKIYLDTSALIKLYIIEDGSVLVDTIISENAASLFMADRFLTFDRRQAKLAEKIGLNAALNS
jgi:predicted nucleic acid-binding protein